MMREWIIYIPVLIWLGILSWYDIKTREIPHSAWVTIPLILAGGYRICLGGWQLVLLAGLVILASEREWIATKIRWGGITSIHGWVPWLTVVFCMAASTSQIGAIAILGFWIAWELKWWGGADSVVGMILVSVFYPVHFIIAFLISQLLSVIFSRFPHRSLCLWSGEDHATVPGIPLFLISIILLCISNFTI